MKKNVTHFKGELLNIVPISSFKFDGAGWVISDMILMLLRKVEAMFILSGPIVLRQSQGSGIVIQSSLVLDIHLTFSLLLCTFSRNTATCVKFGSDGGCQSLSCTKYVSNCVMYVK